MLYNTIYYIIIQAVGVLNCTLISDRFWAGAVHESLYIAADYLSQSRYIIIVFYV